MGTETIGRRLVVSGHVQGVFFRDGVRECARNEGVDGWASNRPDGSVEVLLEGAPAAVEAVIGFCRVGPVSARVDAVEVSEREPERLSGFQIR